LIKRAFPEAANMFEAADGLMDAEFTTFERICQEQKLNGKREKSW
jgi:hypothetical protein